MNIEIIRTFVRVRALAATHGDLAKRLAELDEKTEALAMSHALSVATCEPNSSRSSTPCANS